MVRTSKRPDAERLLMKERYLLCILACLTLGLAPFRPEPHVVEKLRWVKDGEKWYLDIVGD